MVASHELASRRLAGDSVVHRTRLWRHESERTFRRRRETLEERKSIGWTTCRCNRCEGHFFLPGHPRERFIFITPPSRYKTFNQHYLPIQTATTSYDFGLIPYEAGISSQGTHRFIQVTDSEIFNTSNNEAWVDDIRKYAHNEQVAFVVHTGDICYEKGLQEHIQLMNTANMDVPVYYCIGNHDLVKGKYGEELFEKYGSAGFSVN